MQQDDLYVVLYVEPEVLTASVRTFQPIHMDMRRMKFSGLWIFQTSSVTAVLTLYAHTVAVLVTVVAPGSFTRHGHLTLNVMFIYEVLYKVFCFT